jgi:hypothetical protein
MIPGGTGFKDFKVRIAKYLDQESGDELEFSFDEVEVK